jgi:hypothetical protein
LPELRVLRISFAPSSAVAGHRSVCPRTRTRARRLPAVAGATAAPKRQVHA